MTDENSNVDLEDCARSGASATGATHFRVRVDDARHKIDDPKPTGRQLLKLAGKTPVEEHLLFLLLRGGGLEEIQLDETVDLTRPGAERFLSFDSAASFRLELDGERFEWGAKLITGLKLKHLAGVDPACYALWREVRGGEDEPINDDQIIDLSEDGLERFFTVIEKTTAGDFASGGVLPRRDAAYLADHDLAHEIRVSGNQTGVMLLKHSLPGGVFDADAADILILLPPGYPDTSPDMFYCNPWLRLAGSGRYPKCADYAHHFDGVSWQRWSRHNNNWRPGKDGIWTMLKRIECAIREAAH